VPPIDPARPTRKPAKRHYRLRTPTPDQADRARAHAPAPRPVTPDQADRERPAAQRQHDAEFTARVVRTQRIKALRAANKARGLAILTGKGGKTVDASVQFTRDRLAAEQQRAARLAPALTLLEQLSRPVHGEAAAARQIVHDVKTGRGASLSRAAHAGGEGLKLHDKSLFSDVLKEAGVHSKLATGLGGFGLDVALDPTTYLSFGVGSVGRKAVEAEARKATQAALKRGLSKKAADRAGRAAAQKALKRETNKGVQVGFAGRKTSGRTSAKVARGLRLPQAGEKARGSLPGRLVRHVAPSVRPAGVSEHDFLHVRDAMRRARAIAATGEHAVRNRAQAIARLVPGEKHPQITDALEGRSVAGLSGKERKVVEALAHDYDAMHRAEHAAGLVGPKFKEFGYSPRRASPSSSRPAAAGGRAARSSNPPRPAPTAARTQTSAAPAMTSTRRTRRSPTTSVAATRRQARPQAGHRRAPRRRPPLASRARR
jgi:hypothetical protein